jgi:hypothetical protein
MIATTTTTATRQQQKKKYLLQHWNGVRREKPELALCYCNAYHHHYPPMLLRGLHTVHPQYENTHCESNETGKVSFALANAKLNMLDIPGL